MKYKQGISWVVTTIVGWIAYTILDYVKPQFVNTIFKIQEIQLLWIIEITFTVVVSFGFFLIAKEKYGWLKQNPDEKQYNGKKLNDTIFRKLMRIQYKTDYRGDLIFEIPTDERAFLPRGNDRYIDWMTAEIIDFREDHVDAIHRVSIERAIPNLRIGEKFLQKNYKDTYRMWINVKKILVAHNKRRDDFRKQLGNIVVEKFKTEFPTFTAGQIDQPLIQDSYFLDKIQRFLFNTMRHKLEDSEYDQSHKLSKGFTGVAIYTVQSNSMDVLMATLDQAKTDPDKVDLIFREIITNEEIIQSFHKANQIDTTFYDKIKNFSEHLEDEVVNEIDSLQ